MHYSELNPQKIVVFKYRYIGDNVLTIPFLRNLRLNFPQAQIDIITDPVSIPLLQNCPYINQVIPYGHKEKSILDLAFELRQGQYDTAFLLKRSFSSALISFLGGIKHRIGFDTEWRKFLLTIPVTYEKNRYELECYLDVLRALDCEIYSSELELFPDTTISKGLETILQTMHQNKRRKILFCATSSDMRKALPLQHYQDLLRRLVFELGAMIYAVGTVQDKLFYDKLVSSCPEIYDFFINLCGLTDVNESLKIIETVDSVVGIDTGIMHLAAALKKDIVTIYGPTNDVRWQSPQANAAVLHVNNLPCRPCDLKVKCRYSYKCLSEININDVIEKVKDFGLSNVPS